MRTIMVILALISTIVMGLPTAAASDGRGATIFKDRDYRGASTAIPANAWCNNLDNIFGDFDSKTRSIMVEKNFKCSFYTERDCPNYGGRLDVGSKDGGMGMCELPPGMDLKIRSAYCAGM